MPTLTILRGFPGSGKTTFGERITKGLSDRFALVEPDRFYHVEGRYEFRPENKPYAEMWAQALAARGLFIGLSVIVADVFPTLADLEPYRAMALHFGADFQVIEIHGPWPDIHNVCAEDRARMVATWEPYPVAGEADHV